VQLARAFAEFKPTHLIHLAARADMGGKTVADYSANVDGTRNVLAAAAQITTLQHVVVTSTQHVRRPGSSPAVSSEDFAPYEAYGASKVQTELLTRESNLHCAWTIVRPTAIWGPGHTGLANGLWRMIQRGLYMHPQGDPVIRSYGFVKNTVAQITAVFEKPTGIVDRKVFYVGDACIPQIEWVDAFSKALTGQPVRRVPTAMLFSMALMGEMARSVGFSAPIYLSRYKNLVTQNFVPVDEGLSVLGEGHHSLSQGIAETVEWLRLPPR